MSSLKNIFAYIPLPFTTHDKISSNQDIVKALQRSFLSKMNTVYSPMNTVHDNHNILETQVR